MKTRVKVGVLIAVSLLQLAAAASSIARYESTLRTGVIYRIRTEPIDPVDAFRGRYVAVRPAIHVDGPLDADTQRVLDQMHGRQTAYVVLGVDANGFARAADIRSDRPTQGDYLEITSAWPQLRQPQSAADDSTAGYNISFSFDRYYMNAAAAPQAEQKYMEASRRNTETRAWLVVRVKNGVGVIEALYIDGVPIEQVVAGS